MNLNQLKDKLEPFIRQIVRDELKKQKSKSLFGGLFETKSDDEMEQLLRNADKSIEFLRKLGDLKEI